ncbi:hypothetical protein ACOMHN_023596 [Nucella lapillus]
MDARADRDTVSRQSFRDKEKLLQTETRGGVSQACWKVPLTLALKGVLGPSCMADELFPLWYVTHPDTGIGSDHPPGTAVTPVVPCILSVPGNASP